MTRAAQLFAYFFLIILAYYMVKPASRSLFLDQADAAQLPYIWMASALLLFALMPIYQRVVNHYQRIHVVTGTCLLMMSLLILFSIWMRNPGLPVAVTFYIFVDILSVVLVEQFWSLTNSVHRDEEGSRWYGFIASGGLVGGIVGGLLAGSLISSTPVTTADLPLVAAAIIAVMTCLTVWFNGRGRYREHDRRSPPDPMLAVASGGWRALRENRYLLMIALLLLLSQIAEPIVEYQFMSLVEQTHTEREARTAYLSHFFSVLSGFALLINLMVTPLVHRYLGAIGGLLVQPVMLGAATVAFVQDARLTIAAAMKIADRGLSYSVNRASRELLYIPVEAATIYRAKAWIDMVGYRSFKIIGSLMILALTNWLPWDLEYTHFSLVVLGLCVLWVAAILRLRAHYREMRATAVDNRPGMEPSG